MQADDRATWKIDPWAGTIDQVQQAARRCKAQVEAVAPYPEDYDPGDSRTRYNREKDRAWDAAERARRVEITIIEANGFVRSMTEIEDLAGLSPLDHVEGIEVEIGGNGYSSPSAVLRLSKAFGLEVRLAGRDRTWTAGLRHELEEILTPPGRLRPLPGGKGVYFVAAALLFYSLMIGIGVYFRDQTDWSVGPRLAMTIGAPALLVAPLLVLGAKLPNLELLPPGAKPAWERWRKGFVGAFVAVVLGIAGSLLAGAIHA